MAIRANTSIAPVAVVSAVAAPSATAITGWNTAAPTGVVALIPPTADGQRFTRAYITARDTIGAASRLLMFRGTSASACAFFKGKAVPTYTWSTTLDFTDIDLGYSEDTPLLLAPNEGVWIGMATGITTAGVQVVAEGGKYGTPT